MATFNIKNVDRKFKGWKSWLSQHVQDCKAAAAAPEARTISLRVGNRVVSQGGNTYKWTVFVAPSNPEAAAQIASVTFQLHETFEPARVTASAPEHGEYAITRTGWGVFDVALEVCAIDGSVHPLVHRLNFEEAESGGDVEISLGGAVGAPAVAAAAPAGDDDDRMDSVSEALMHGVDGVGNGWKPPYVTFSCVDEARPGYQSMSASEYHDDPSTLQAKIAMFANMIRKSEHFVAYTGAGISTSSGIDDYASKGHGQLAKLRASRPKVDAFEATPTLAHFGMAALHKAGHLKHWVQQNHDGLPQKAGYPQHALNEIHGAWFDPANPVVPMSGSLRDDLCEWMEKEEDSADLVIAMGTSLCGMNADRMVATPGKKRIRHRKGLGAVIVGFQQTRMDEYASLRIFASCDEVMLLLARELELDVGTEQYRMSKLPDGHRYTVPYGDDGMPSDRSQTLDLSEGAKVKLTAGPGKGFEGRVYRVPARKTGAYAYSVSFPCTREGSKHFGKGQNLYKLGGWMLEEAMQGKLHMIPLVNVRP